MLLPALILLFIFLLLSAFFSSSETAFVAANPIKIDYQAREGSKNARLVKKLLQRIDRLLATILIGNTLVNAAAASIATFIFVSFMPDKKNQAVLLATIITTLLILILSEINPKTYAAYHPQRLAFLFARPIRFFVLAFYPLVKFFTFLTHLIFPKARALRERPGSLNEEELKGLFAWEGVKGMSALRSQMISGVLDIGSRPVREIMIPRRQIKAIQMGASPQEILDLIRSGGFSRFPVYQERLDNIQGLIHAKDVIPYLMDDRELDLSSLVREPLFVPESASLESVLLQMQASANHMVFVVDEFGNMEGIVTLEDILEELVGEIRDEHDGQLEELIIPLAGGVYSVKGSTPIKWINQNLPVDLPEKSEYTTVAGFFLDEFGRIPREADELVYGSHRFFVEKMNKHQIDRLQVALKSKEPSGDETHNQE